ncbi:MAG: CDP-alcohol phosphatidyltransferase family protein [Bifidobacteriaceae bacterium]|nr:CDP-alcohol phosphatidyltransferase family protein [Bifidobacteriaceae bacterium]
MLEFLRSPIRALFNPLVSALVRLKISANTVTVIGSLCTIIACFVTAVTGELFVGTLVITLFVLCDSLDGAVAAKYGGGTTFGAFLDSTLDRIADWAMLSSVMIYYFMHTSLHNILTIIGLVATGISIMASFVISYARARAQSLNSEAAHCGIAQRADRILITLVGTGFTGLFHAEIILTIAMVLLAILGLITVFQRIIAVKNDMQ